MKIKAGSRSGALAGPRFSAGGAAGGDFPGLSNHNSGAVAMCMGPCPMRLTGYFAHIADMCPDHVVRRQYRRETTVESIALECDLDGDLAGRPVAQAGAAVVSKRPRFVHIRLDLNQPGTG